MLFLGNNQEYLRLQEFQASPLSSSAWQIGQILKKNAVQGYGHESNLTIFWNTGQPVNIKIDGLVLEIKTNQIICLTDFHHVEWQSIEKGNLIQFSRNFYCIIHHDDEVGCKGILFFGASQVPIITIPIAELDKFHLLWKAFLAEMNTKDNLQLEMLQMMLTRFLILCTRIFKEQQTIAPTEKSHLSIIREFHFLVEQHFKTKHTVAQYADMLNKSPKTLSNIFAKTAHKTPLQIIQERKMLEARHLLYYSDKSVKEIAYELGYEDLQTFSRFFKAQEGVSPVHFKEGKNAHI